MSKTRAARRRAEGLAAPRGARAWYRDWLRRPETWIGLVVVGAIVLAVVFVLNPGGERGNSGSAPIAAARLVETPPTAGGNSQIGLDSGTVAPDFEFSDLDGNRRRLSDYRGKPLILNFWATWCIACAAEMPAFAELVARHEGEGLRLLAMNLGDQPGAARSYLEHRGVLRVFDVGMDPTVDIGRYYQAFGLPLSVFITPEGEVSTWWLGELTLPKMEELAAPILGSDPAVAVDRTPAPLFPGVQYPDLGRRHLQAGETFDGYNSNPPTSGPHSPQVAPWGVLSEAIAPEVLVHNLEHGGVGILYRDANAPMLPLLTKFVERYVERGKLVLLAQFPQMPTAYAFVAWTRLDAFDDFDADAILRIEAFVQAYDRAFNPEGF